jgi:hypothetical protein
MAFDSFLIAFDRVNAHDLGHSKDGISSVIVVVVLKRD